MPSPVRTLAGLSFAAHSPSYYQCLEGPPCNLIFSRGRWWIVWTLRGTPHVSPISYTRRDRAARALRSLLDGNGIALTPESSCHVP